ncbi:MAG: hypothetical protein KGM18_02915 [Sphingomonadales bacterium]|nr:hypothetical protein [Sphingomonadales bacterium]
MTLAKTLILLGAAALLPAAAGAEAPASPPVSVRAGALAGAGSVSPRFLSYNIEMVELTGGRFWRPYGSPGNDRYEYRPPLDLADGKLRRLAAALGPAYVRFSGTWANATWFADAEKAPDKPPAGFDSVLTRRQWRGAVAFARAVDAEILTSFATSMGTRDAAGAWQPATAARWLAYTRAIGGHIAATEFGNEPNMAWLMKGPTPYAAADYRRDYATFARWLRQASPRTLLVAPGLAELGEPTRTVMRKSPGNTFFENDAMLAADSPRPDVFSFHFYGGGSERCGGQMLGHGLGKALDPAWLAQIDPAIARVRELRDRQAPGTPLWDTETGETACGGNPWAATFADSFRFVDTLGRSARAGVQVFVHNTLAASDYALLDPGTHDPRPNYWAALLWKRTMGTTVLAAPPSPSPQLRLYAHCLVGSRGGVALAAINLADGPQRLAFEGPGRVRVMQAPTLDGKTVTVNGRTPALAARGGFSGIDAVPAPGGLSLPGRAIAFVALPRAANPACR